MQRTNTPLRRGSAAVRLLVVPLALFLFMASSALATVELTNVVGTPEKRNDTSSPKPVQFVSITYSIANVPQGGVTVAVEATLTDAKGNSFTVGPAGFEAHGDIGPVSADGAKKIDWNIESTLVRLSRQGKYHCVVTISVPGQDANPSAVLTVNSYVTTNWNYFNPGTAEIKNLQRTGSFQAPCSPVQGQSWQTTVDPDAVFYKGTVTSLPSWRGRRSNDVITGTPGNSGCSAFLAVKNLGKPDEKIWVNFAKQQNMQLDADRNGVPEQNFVWEYQFRYTSNKKDGSKSLSAGNAGKPGEDLWTEWDKGQDFSLDLSLSPPIEEKSNTFDVEVVRREFKYSYQGTQTLTFVAVGDAYFEPSDTKPNTIVLTNGDATVNGLLNVGSPIEIDTTVDNGAITTNGAWSTAGKAEIFKGAFSAKLTTDIVGNIGLVAMPTLNPKWNIGGFSISFEKIHFVGPPDKSTGVQFDIRILLQQLSSGCAFDIKKDPLLPPGSSVAGFKLNGVTLSDQGWDLTGIEAQNVGCAIAPVFCLKSFKANYFKAADSLALELIMKGPIFDDIGGGLTIVKGDIDGWRIVMKLAGGGVGVGAIPIPYPPPPANAAEWRGFDVSVLHATNGPFTMRGKMMFANNSEWKKLPGYSTVVNLLGKLSWINVDDLKLFEFDGTGEYVHGQSFGVGCNTRLFSLVKDTWIMESSDSINIHANSSLFSVERTGTQKVFNFGGNQWMFTGTGQSSVTLLPGFKAAFSLTGQVQIPTLFKNNPVFVAVNDWFQLPWNLTKVGFQMNDLAASFTADIPRFGPAKVSVDFTRNPLTEPAQFIWIQNSGPLHGTRMKDERGRSPLGAGDTTWTQFPVTSAVERAFVQIWGVPAPSNSVLVDPSGRTYAGTAQDSSVIYYPSGGTGQSAMWVAMSPAAGTWKVGVLGSHPGDSVYAWARYQDNSSFTFSSETQGRTIVAHWGGAASSPNATVDLFLDNDQQGYDGAYIGTAKVSDGEFRFTMTDSLPECGYYIYAMRNDSGQLSSSYSPTYHANPKLWLPAPANIQAVATASGDVTVTWLASPDPNALMYAVRVSDPTGHDSVYTTVNLNYTMATIHVENWQSKHISIQTLGENNTNGCWSDPVSMTLAGVDDPVTGGDRSQEVEMTVAPQPATNIATVFANLTRAAEISIDLYDANGRKVMPLRHGGFEPGTVRTDIDATSLPNGIYIVRLSGSGLAASRKIVVRK
ncbi:MAG: T9SS type A sorting domain-containing protein [Bacteroidetes bacterium]|nr:T9SS type A sorting domain-containing protein [Bacteroidota bacterium]